MGFTASKLTDDGYGRTIPEQKFDLRATFHEGGIRSPRHHRSGAKRLRTDESWVIWSMYA